MATKRVADVMATILADYGVRDCFMLTGGGAMFLNDAFGRESRFRKFYNHHEQASAIAAESYGRLSGKPALVNVTTGPGGINALNGVFGAYTDSIPMIVVSGQVKRETCMSQYDLSLRQLGDQEVDIVKIVGGITKYAISLDDPSQVRKVTEKAIYLATRGRPGPVWIDVPIDVQAAPVLVEKLEPFDPLNDDQTGVSENTMEETSSLIGESLARQVHELMEEICKAERPVILAGTGIRTSGTHDQFIDFIEQLGAPVVTGWNAHDVIPNCHPLYVGRPGTVGDRGGNFAVQSADYVLILGCRCNIRQISYNWGSFARNAKVAMVDIDRSELRKPTLSLHRPIHADLRNFFDSLLLLDSSEFEGAENRSAYLERSRVRASQYPVCLPEYFSKTGPLNPYVFGHELFRKLDQDDIIVTGDGTACVTVFQVATIKPGQRLYTNSGCASMGYDLPAAIGAWVASGADRIICIAGDGSIMMNLQELQTIAGSNLPIKIFVINNDGYHSIRQSQQNHFPDNIVGCGSDSGLSFPDFQKLAGALGISSSRINSEADLATGIDETLMASGPHLCEVIIDKSQQFAPKLSSRKLADGSMVSSPLEDLVPFLREEELEEAMYPCEILR